MRQTGLAENQVLFCVYYSFFFESAFSFMSLTVDSMSACMVFGMDLSGLTDSTRIARRFLSIPLMDTNSRSDMTFGSISSSPA